MANTTNNKGTSTNNNPDGILPINFDGATPINGGMPTLNVSPGMNNPIPGAILNNMDNLSPAAQAAIAATPSSDRVNKGIVSKPVINDGPVSISLNVDIKELDIEPNKKYFVRLPHSGYEFNVRGLTVEEEDTIKSSNSSTKRVAETIMKVLYNCISNDVKTKDHPFATYESFIRNISQSDRDTIALAVIEQTYESTHDMNIRCAKCGKSFTESVCLPDCITYKHYMGKTPILQKRHVLNFPDLRWKMYLKIPTVADELKTLNTNQMSGDLQKSADYIFIDKIEYTMKVDTGQFVEDSINNCAQIYGMIKGQPAIIRKRIEKEYEKFRGDYGVTGAYDTVCKYCENPITVTIVPISHFLFLVQ